MDWQIDNWLSRKHRGMDGAPEGGCKTTFGAWLCVCIASGKPFFGHSVQQGQVLIIDEESAEDSLIYTLNRFSQGMGLRDYHQLPIEILSMQGFRFGRKNELILSMVEQIKPIFIRLDSLVAMLPGGRQGLAENNSDVGVAVRDTINSILNKAPGANTFLAAHSKKPVKDWTLEEFLEQREMQSFVRGHSSIVGEACDTGFALKKITDDPLQFIIRTIARRQPAPPMSRELVYVQMEEEAYGKGAARLVQIEPVPTPPSKLVKELFKMFKDRQPHTWEAISKQSALYTRKQNQVAIRELNDRHVIISHANKPFVYFINPNYKRECEDEYLKQL